MDDKLLFSLKAFSGIDNVNPAYRLPINLLQKDGIEKTVALSAISNLDIDNAYALKTRPGETLKLAGTDIHSGWSDGATCLFVDGDTLYALDSSYVPVAVKNGLTRGARMVYQPVNDRVYLTNGHFIGYYKELSVTELSVPGIEFKEPLPPGQRLTYFRGSLMVASGKVVYIADPLCDHFDVRHGFRVFGNDLTMLRGIDDGIYAADGKTWFLTTAPKLRTDELDEFRRDKVLDVDAVPGTDIVISGQYIKDGVPEHHYAMWLGTDGIYLGSNAGKVVSITSGRYDVQSAVIGSSCFRQTNGQNHLIMTMG